DSRHIAFHHRAGQRRLRFDRALKRDRKSQPCRSTAEGMVMGRKGVPLRGKSMIDFHKSHCFFPERFYVHVLDSYSLTPDGVIVIRFANGGFGPGAKSCGFGANMSGVIESIRRTLLSCTSLARNGLIGLGGTLISATPGHAGDLPLLDGISSLFDLNHQE